MKYEVILMDADETLLDFKKSEQAAFAQTFRRYGIEPSAEIFARYTEINHGLWAAFERGEISKPDILGRRFRETFREFGIMGIPADFEEAYQIALSEGSYKIDGAEEVCSRLSRKYDLYVVTNGVAMTQHRRLRESGLEPYFKGSFVSEEIGFQKPQKEYFSYVFSRIPGFLKERALIVGDSLTSDIAGGKAAGIDTCWVCRDGHPEAGEADYIITDLRELLTILGENENE